MDTPLALALKARIASEGPIPFHDLMTEALAAYYARGPVIGGTSGDFSTSVSFASFRDAIARLIVEAERALGEPMRVVELGAGTGELARAVTERWRGEYATVDASPALRERQSAVAGVRAVASMRDLPPAPSLVFGNEVLDALPVRRVVGGAREGELLEVVVGLDAKGGFREGLAPLRDEGVAARLEREGTLPARGQVFDVAPALEEFVRGAARLVAPRGFLLFIDYGDAASALYAADRLNGTLAAYRAHGKHHDPYEELGERDLTADVDFTAVENAAREAGLEPFGVISQERFLTALGADPNDFAVRAAALGSAFHVFAARRGTDAKLSGF